jgi:hypothetical protein
MQPFIFFLNRKSARLRPMPNRGMKCAQHAKEREKSEQVQMIKKQKDGTEFSQEITEITEN